MAKRPSGLMEDVLEITSRMPWWVGVLMALIAFIACRTVAGIDVTPPTDPRQMANVVIRQSAKSFAGLLQWVLPLLFLVGAVVSALKQRRRLELHKFVADSADQSSLHKMSWRDFERLVGEYFRRRGFQVSETGSGGPDGGVDLVLTKGRDKYLVQCKQWRAQSVGVEPVRELYGVMAAGRVAGGFLVTAGAFTREAQKFAHGREVQLIDGQALAGEVRRQQSAPGAIVLPPIEKSAEAPPCPKCGSSMVLRTARQGANAGGRFWGCSTFPKCRGTLPAA